MTKGYFASTIEKILFTEFRRGGYIHARETKKRIESLSKSGPVPSSIPMEISTSRVLMNWLLFFPDLKNQNKEIILVSSGAIGVGMNKLKHSTTSCRNPPATSCCSRGASRINEYLQSPFSSLQSKTAQLLLTRDIIEFPQSRENVCNTLEQLLAMGIIPIINENDTVAIDELDHLTKFGDNDQLSAIVAQLVHADPVDYAIRHRWVLYC